MLEKVSQILATIIKHDAKMGSEIDPKIDPKIYAKIDAKKGSQKCLFITPLALPSKRFFHQPPFELTPIGSDWQQNCARTRYLKVPSQRFPSSADPVGM